MLNIKGKNTFYVTGAGSGNACIRGDHLGGFMDGVQSVECDIACTIKAMIRVRTGESCKEQSFNGNHLDTIDTAKGIYRRKFVSYKT